MKTISTTVYQFDELSDSAKNRAREWRRESNAEDNFFSESVIEDAASIAALMGLDIRQRRVNLHGGGTRYEPAVYWSGFCSQGDGACCEGDWVACRVKPGKVRDYAPQDTELHRLAAEFERLALEFPSGEFSVAHRGRYSHEHCTEFSFNLDGGDELTDAQEARLDDAEDEAKEAAKDFMRWIYRQLEKEYEYQNSDEQVDESIRANEYEFTEDGERF